MTLEYWIKYAVSIVGALTTLFVALLPFKRAILAFFRARKEKKVLKEAKEKRERDDRLKEKVAITNLSKLQEINDIMHEIEHHPEIHRCLLFIGHNSGRLPDIGSPYYISCIGKAVAEDSKDNVGTYTKIEASEQYVGMLLDLFQHREIMFITAEEPDGQLKTYYQAEGVKQSMIFYLRVSPQNEFLYMSVSTTNDKPLSVQAKAFVRLKVTAIQSSINQMYVV